MTVNETQLNIYIYSLKGNIRAYERLIREMTKVVAILDKIELSDGTAKIDYDTGKAMTTARRDEIYDSCLPEIKRLLNITEEED